MSELSKFDADAVQRSMAPRAFALERLGAGDWPAASAPVGREGDVFLGDVEVRLATWWRDGESEPQPLVVTVTGRHVALSLYGDSAAARHAAAKLLQAADMADAHDAALVARSAS